MLEAAIRIFNNMRRFDREHNLDALLEIAEDGKIDESERKQFDEIMDDLRDILKSGLELEVFCEEG